MVPHGFYLPPSRRNETSETPLLMSDESHTALTQPALPPSEPPALAKPVSRIRWGIHLAIMASLPLVAGFAGSASRGKGPALTHTARGLLIVCGFELLFVGIPFGLAWLASRATKDDLLLRWRPGFLVLPLGALYSVGIRIAVAIVMAIVAMIAIISSGASPAQVQTFVQTNRPQVEKLIDVHAMSESPAYYWLSVIVVSFVVGGLREEWWRSSFLAGLRSLWPRTFGSNGGAIAGAGIAALFFGVGHIPQGLLAAGMITVVGFLLGLIMVLHRSIWPSVVAHGFFDAATMALLPWLMRYMQELQRMQHVGG
jgi:membrane protease YdiL (CAAX protease family)